MNFPNFDGIFNDTSKKAWRLMLLVLSEFFQFCINQPFPGRSIRNNAILHKRALFERVYVNNEADFEVLIEEHKTESKKGPPGAIQAPTELA